MLSRQELYTLQVGLNTYAGQLNVQWHYILAMTVVTMIPVVLVFVLLQRFITARVPRGYDGYWTIIRALDERGPWTVSQVDGETNVDRADVAQYVRRLVKAGVARIVGERPNKNGAPAKLHRLAQRRQLVMGQPRLVDLRQVPQIVAEAVGGADHDHEQVEALPAQQPLADGGDLADRGQALQISAAVVARPATRRARGG